MNRDRRLHFQEDRLFILNSYCTYKKTFIKNKGLYIIIKINY